MRQLKLYIETSVWNFLYAEDSPEKKATTELFFREVEDRNHEIYISELVLDEFNNAPGWKQVLLKDAIDKYKPSVFDVHGITEHLVRNYLKYDLLSEKQLADLGHIAVATFYQMDVLVSWNMRHIVKRKTRIMANALNNLFGFRPIDIFTPEEVIYYDRDS